MHVLALLLRYVEIDPFGICVRNLGRCFDVVLNPCIMYQVNQELQLARILNVLREGGIVFLEGPDIHAPAPPPNTPKVQCISSCDTRTVPIWLFVHYEVAGNNEWFISVAVAKDILRAVGLDNPTELYNPTRDDNFWKATDNKPWIITATRGTLAYLPLEELIS